MNFETTRDFLLDLQDRYDESTHPEFEIGSEAPEPEELDSSFGGEKWRTPSAPLRVLGSDHRGSHYCVWQTDSGSPVVYLDSSWDDSCMVVLAGSIEEFLEILYSGKVWQGVDDGFGDADDDERTQVDSVQQAIKEKLGREPRDPDTIQKAALAKHPDFFEWCSERNEF